MTAEPASLEDGMNSILKVQLSFCWAKFSSCLPRALRCAIGKSKWKNVKCFEHIFVNEHIIDVICFKACQDLNYLVNFKVDSDLVNLIFASVSVQWHFVIF